MSSELPTSCTTIEEVGSTGVGAVTITFIIFLAATIIFIIKARGSGEQRKYYYLTIYICAFSGVAYFGMLSGQGWSVIEGCRQFFYIRYLDLLFTSPLIVILLGLLSGAGYDAIAGAVGADVIYVIAGYMGSVSVISSVKWFWFLISIAGIAGVLVHFAIVFKKSADAKDSELSQLYGKLSWLSILVWAAYPLVWLFSQGFASFSVSFEVCCYALLDIFSKAILSFMIMSAHELLGNSSGSGEGAESRQYV